MEWLRRFHNVGNLNFYLLGDPAGTKRKRSDYTCFVVLGVSADHQIFLVDLVRDKLNLRQRWEAYRDLYLKWQPMESAYEEYGMQTDREYFEERMGIEGVYFTITPLGGHLEKKARIRRLQPVFENKKFLIPHELIYQRDGRPVDLIHEFIVDEYSKFPFPQHDDILDAISRIRDLNVVYPAITRPKAVPRRKFYDPLSEDKRKGVTWMAN